MDEQFKRGAKLKPLECIPLVLEDNFDTADMPTHRRIAGAQRSFEFVEQAAVRPRHDRAMTATIGWIKCGWSI
jgi:hypothetical protein